jgi:hypothetical protein
MDLEGRVVMVRRKDIAVVNVYAVNGTSKPYYDRTGRVAGDRHELKRRFQSSVMDLGCELRKHGGVVMAGDWNVSRSVLDTFPRLRTEEPHARARAELNARLISDGFVDVWRERHAQERVYTWFNRRARDSMRRASTTSWYRRTSCNASVGWISWISCREATTHRRESKLDTPREPRSNARLGAHQALAPGSDFIASRARFCARGVPSM